MDVRRRTISGSIQNKNNSGGGSGGGSTTSGSYTVVLNSQWQKSSTISNPDSNTYDGVYESYSNKGVNSSAAVMYIDISGLSEFSFYIRSYAESNYDYVMVSQLDKTITSGSSYSDTTLVKAHTRGNQQSGTSISSYTLVEFTGIDKGSHRITVLYRKDTSQHSNDDRGYVLIPKSQGSSNNGGEPDIEIGTNNVIYYTSSNGKVVTPYRDAFGATIKSNVYSNGKGVITFDGDITMIGRSAFQFCNNLTSITIPESVITIENMVFSECSSLTEFNGKFAEDNGRILVVDGTLMAFAPAGITEYTIPNSVTTIGKHAFYYCTKLTSVTIPDSVTTIVGYAFFKCTSLKSVNIPNSVTSIGELAFRECTNLTSVTIGDSVTSIVSEAFRDCSSLTSVYCKATTPPSLGGSYIFYNNAADRLIYVPIESVEAYKSAERWSEYADYIEGYEFVVPQVAGDVAYWDGTNVQTISKDKWNSSLGTPIGVVVIPSNFLPDGKARIVSLKAVDSSGNATTSHTSMHWEQSGKYVDTTLTNYNRVPITNNTGGVSSSYSSTGYLPSDNFAGDTSFVDSGAKYSTNDTTKIPSPYNGSEFNTDYSKDISGYNNALSDFNGLSNTQVLVGLGSDYQAANAAWNYSDGASNIQWYLPSAGELGFLVARLKAINSTISMLSGVAVPSDFLWSSTECGGGDAYNVNTSNGRVFNVNKDNYLYVRPFASLGGGV